MVLCVFNDLAVSKILENSSLNSLVSVLENLNINVMIAQSLQKMRAWLTDKDGTSPKCMKLRFER